MNSSGKIKTEAEKKLTTTPELFTYSKRKREGGGEIEERKRDLYIK